ncbi:MAG: hypothetical protein QXT64_02005 [Desulfurococcaceae archaeon]
MNLGNPVKIPGYLYARLMTEKYRDDFDVFEGWTWSVSGTITRTVSNSILNIEVGANNSQFDMSGKWTLPSKDNIALRIRFRITSTTAYWIDIGFRKAPNDTNNEIFIARINETTRSPQCAKIVGGSYSYNTASPSIQFTANTWYDFILVVSRSYMSIWYYDPTAGRFKAIHSWFTSLPSGPVVPFIRGGGNTGTVIEIDYVIVGDYVGEGLKDPFFLKSIDNTIYTDGNGYSYVFAQGSTGVLYNQSGYYGQGVLLVYRTRNPYDLSSYELLGKIFNDQRVAGDAIIINQDIYIYYTYFPDGITGGSGGIGVAKISLNDFLSMNWNNITDLGIKITDLGARDLSVYYSPSRNKYYLVCRIDSPAGYSLYESNDGINFTRKGNLQNIFNPTLAGEHPTILTETETNDLIIFGASTGGGNNLRIGICNPDTLVCTDVRDIFSDTEESLVEAHVPTILGSKIVTLYQVSACSDLCYSSSNCWDGTFKLKIMYIPYTPNLVLSIDKTQVKVNEQFTLSFNMYPKINVIAILQKRSTTGEFTDIKQLHTTFGSAITSHFEQLPGTYKYRVKVVL